MFRYRGAEARDLIGSCVCRVVRDEILGNVDRKVQRSKSRRGIPFRRNFKLNLDTRLYIYFVN